MHQEVRLTLLRPMKKGGKFNGRKTFEDRTCQPWGQGFQACEFMSALRHSDGSYQGYEVSRFAGWNVLDLPERRPPH